MDPLPTSSMYTPPSRSSWEWGWERDIEIHPLTHGFQNTVLVPRKHWNLFSSKILLVSPSSETDKIKLRLWNCNWGQEPIYPCCHISPRNSCQNSKVPPESLEMEGLRSEDSHSRWPFSNPSPHEPGDSLWISFLKCPFLVRSEAPGKGDEESELWGLLNRTYL